MEYLNYSVREKKGKKFECPLCRLTVSSCRMVKPHYHLPGLKDMNTLFSFLKQADKGRVANHAQSTSTDIAQQLLVMQCGLGATPRIYSVWGECD